jgi:hypothetical protein
MSSYDAMLYTFKKLSHKHPTFRPDQTAANFPENATAFLAVRPNVAYNATAVIEDTMQSWSKVKNCQKAPMCVFVCMLYVCIDIYL